MPANSLRASFTGDSLSDKMTIELRGDSKPSTLVVIKSTEDNEMEQFDKDNYTNPQYVIPYINDIMINMRATEVKFIKNSITTFYI